MALTRQQRRFLQLYRTRPLTVAQAAKKVGCTARTVRRWAQRDPDFGREYEDAKVEQHKLRIGMIEDALFQRILVALDPGSEQGLPAALIIFWLKANAGDKYRLADKVYLHHTGQVDSKQTVDLEARVEYYRDLLQGGQADGPAGNGTGASTGVDD